MHDITKSRMGKRSIQSLRQTNGFYVREQKNVFQISHYG